MLTNFRILFGRQVGQFSAGFFVIALCSTVTIAQAAAPIPTKFVPQPTCPIAQATYTAIGNPALSLQFRPLIKPAIASEIVSFTLKHKTRGEIVTYNLGSSNGYASLYLRDAATSIEDDRGSDLKPVFFNANWQHSGLPLKTAPQYFFVSGLGSNDWYTERLGNRDQPVGEVMWQFSGCATAPQVQRPKSAAVAAIVKQEIALLKQPPNRETKAALDRLIRELVVEAAEIHPTGTLLPSSKTAAYFGDLYQLYPQSGVVAIMYARSLETQFDGSLVSQADDGGQVDRIYQAALKANPRHPVLLEFYAEYKKTRSKR
jgi:hypothetical protein